jgi:endonuclease III
MERREMKANDKRIPKALMERVEGRFSVGMGIDLSSRDPEEIFKWFFASVLFGTRISESIVSKTYIEFEKKGIISPRGILHTGWDGLVEILDRGGYARYDFKTATKLLDLSTTLLDHYRGDLKAVHSTASGPRDLEDRLKALAKGIGDVTVNIFLREMRGIWEKAEPFAPELAVNAARHMGILPLRGKDKGKLLAFLKKRWTDVGMKMKDFPDFEAALVRLGKDYCRKALCSKCPMRGECKGMRE